jgi:hypothetical protein
MGRPRFRTRVRGAAEGLKARVSASPDIWDETTDDQCTSVHHMEDVSTWLELPPDFRAPDDHDADYRQSARFDLGAADFEPDEDKWLAFESDPELSSLSPPGHD